MESGKKFSKNVCLDLVFVIRKRFKKLADNNSRVYFSIIVPFEGGGKYRHV